MPFYLHQWNYQSDEIHALIGKPHDRGHVVSVAVEAFGGKLHGFYFCFGEYDGVSVTEFPDNKTALACMMAIASQGGLAKFKTTPLINMEEGLDAMRFAESTLADGSPYESPSRKL